MPRTVLLFFSFFFYYTYTQHSVLQNVNLTQHFISFPKRNYIRTHFPDRWTVYFHYFCIWYTPNVYLSEDTNKQIIYSLKIISHSIWYKTAFDSKLLWLLLVFCLLTWEVAADLTLSLIAVVPQSLLEQWPNDSYVFL